LCGGFGWKTGEVERAMADGVEEGWIVHLGYLEDGQVAALYRGAAAVVLPSIYEGFGLPALEAMVAGIPLVCSDIAVLREVAGDAALYAPPGEPRAWAARVGELLASPELCADLGRRGRERAQQFDWRRTADETVRVWREAAAGGAGVAEP
jgi:alpha-1,3-rhamnosyl/mannosyltransferase